TKVELATLEKLFEDLTVEQAGKIITACPIPSSNSPLDLQKKQYRQALKALNFAKIYGATPELIKKLTTVASEVSKDMDLLTIFEVQKSLTPPPPAEFKAEYSVSFDLAEAPDYVSIFKPVPTSTTQKELDDAKAELHSLLLKMPPGPPAWTIESNAATALKAKIKALEGKIQHEKMVHATPLIIKEP